MAIGRRAPWLQVVRRRIDWLDLAEVRSTAWEDIMCGKRPLLGPEKVGSGCGWYRCLGLKLELVVVEKLVNTQAGIYILNGLPSSISDANIATGDPLLNSAFVVCAVIQELNPGCTDIKDGSTTPARTMPML